MQQCPNCRASYQQGDRCRRCGMDLSPLLRIETEVEGLLQNAMRSLSHNDLKTAEQTLTQAAKLHTTPEVQAMLGYVRVLSVYTGVP